MTSEQRPPVNNGHYFGVPRVVVVHKFDCTVTCVQQPLLGHQYSGRYKCSSFDDHSCKKWDLKIVVLNDSWGQFYQCSTSSFCACRSLKLQKDLQLDFFALLGSARMQAVHRMLMKLTPLRYLKEVISSGLTIIGKLQSSGCLKGMRQLQKSLFRFWPLLNQASFLEVAGAVMKICLSLKPNHHWEI